MRQRKIRFFALCTILSLLTGCSAISRWLLVNRTDETVRVTIQFADSEFSPEEIRLYKIQFLLDDDVGGIDFFTVFEDTAVSKPVEFDKLRKTFIFDLAQNEYADILLSSFAPANRVSVRIQGESGRYAEISGTVAQPTSAYIKPSDLLITRGTSCTPVRNAYRCVTKIKSDMLAAQPNK
ncbi:hypothetical protein [Turneriella parva]|uniref:Lipoprotein n=1 Tax=Turneriella parva (strain ATCC BAA-1111 / DSM 21527 / NCTC 11395 / H) TaxID=869212 RepID=I4B4D1_TURPD|nr:hypothetical protein [Turneriella parva]AFM12138.1 hypothetical protein Turpa_1490 [Turneriella parva DSM 21527]